MKIVRPLKVTDSGSFSRASSAVYRDATGALQTAAADQPRWDYDPSDLGAGPTLLLEPAAQNLFYPSALSLTPASSGPGDEFQLASTAMDLLGYQSTVLRLSRFNSNTNWTFMEWSVPGLVPGKSYTISFFIKRDHTMSDSVVDLFDIAPNPQPNSGVNIAWNGEVPVPTAHNAHWSSPSAVAVESKGNGWYRISFVPPTDADSSVQTLRLRVTPDRYSGYVGDSGVFVGGVQIEEGTVATSLIPTVSAPVARAAETSSAGLLSTVPENDYAAWSEAVSYAVDTKTIRNHRIYQSLQGSNLNKVPESSPTFWQDIGPTSRWAMFDDLRGTQSQDADSIAVALCTSGRVNTVALLNVSAAQVRVRMVDPLDGVVYDRTVSMIASTGVTDWYSWFYEPVERLSDLVLTDLPVYSGAVVTVTLSDSGKSVKCGSLIVGLMRDIGLTQYGIGMGIQDYSVKSVDDWGNYLVQQRAFSKRRSFTVQVDNGMVDQVATLLEGLRATPILYVGADRFASTAVFGFYKDFNIEIQHLSQSLCSLEIEGLT